MFNVHRFSYSSTTSAGFNGGCTMKRLVAVVIGVLVLSAGSSYAQAAGPPAAAAFERLKALDGDWVDVDGAFGKKGAVAVTYRVTGGGTAVVESFPVGTP